MVNDVLRSFFAVGADAPFCGRHLEAQRTTAIAYPVGSWFTPCRPSDTLCEM